ncbi:hypothetical protein SDC9_116123 [bioreactor metagenome]|uniref:Uncharacterized protein n=1 Tax=bioreactor metagenome TaxID=1076179 RepID=A0A645BUR5_9ZZZZ
MFANLWGDEAVARLFHRMTEGVEVRFGFVILNGKRFVRKVYLGARDAGHLGGRALHMCRATGAGHAGYRIARFFHMGSLLVLPKSFGKQTFIDTLYVVFIDYL